MLIQNNYADLVKREWIESGRQIHISFNEIILYVGVPKNGVQVYIVYHIHIIEITWFIKDLFRQTEANSTLLGGLGTEVAYT